MSPNRRIFLNIIATYGRSLFAMVCGIFTGRWVLSALGQTDYGLFAVIGGLIGVVSFVNATLASAVSRFFAYSIGQSQDANNLEPARRWFNTAVTIHTVIPAILIIVGLPIGEWYIRWHMVLPVDRIETCIWVFRLSCFSTFVGMVNVPFTAMYVAKQYIAELTIYSFIGTIANFCMVAYMITHPMVWLLRYAVGMCLISVIPQIVICVRAFKVFDECRLRKEYLLDWSQLKAIFGYVSWQMLGNLFYMLRTQGLAIVVNKGFGPLYNATLGITSVVIGQTNQLSASMNGAFAPAITTLAGSGDRDAMMSMSYRSCKFGSILTILFVLPIILECDYIVALWLKNPPPMVNMAIILSLVALAIGSCSRGMSLAMNADGRIAIFSVVLAMVDLACFGAMLIAVFLLHMGFLSLLYILIGYNVIWNIVAALVAQWRIGFSFATWLYKCVWPIAWVSFVSLGFGYGCKLLLPSGFFAAVLTMAVETVVYCVCVYLCVFDSREKDAVRVKVIGKILGRGGK